MRRIFTYPFRFALPGVALAVVTVAGLAWAQDQPAAQAQDPEPVDRGAVPSPPNAPPAPAPRRNLPAYGLPPQLTLKAGTYVNIRINQALSSDRNHAGDTFSASLIQPVIVDGVVVAPRGQMVYGRVAEAEKAHGGKDSRLGLELTSLMLADGAQAPMHTQLVARQGPQTPGSIETGTVIGTTAAGAVIGGAAGRGEGAAIGAGAGAAAGLAAVLLTHNHPTVLYPETVLTFSVTTPVTINTANAPQAFRFVGPEDYQANATHAAPRPTYVYRPGYYPYLYGYPYYYPYYSYYWGPRFGIGIGFGRHWR
ncbi:MAG TPA: hypothetical protein VKF41_00690 [Bryobacteraceae bacterium]|nr:hypothetical protein [Bryobacteraceae bacterium]